MGTRNRILVALVVLGIAACQGVPSPAPPTPDEEGPPTAAIQAPSPVVDEPAAPSAAPSTFAALPPVGEITWQSTGLNREVGVLRVPLDYSEPGGEQVALALERRRAAKPDARIGTLVMLAGGPGGSGVGMVRGAESQLPQAVLDRFDLVGFDSRGMGLTRPRLDCELTNSPQTWEAADRASLDAWMAVLQKDVDACAASAGPILAHVGTAETARDMELLRQALGEDRISVLGLSYGTIVAQVYAERFPEHVRAAVLDSPVDLAADAASAQADYLAAVQAAFDEFLAVCTADRSCPLWSDGDPRAAYDRLVAKLEKAPLGELTRARLVRVVHWGLLVGDHVPLATALAAAVQGDPAPAIALEALGSPTDNAYAIAVNTLDFGRGSISDWEADTRDALAISPDFAGLPDWAAANAIWPVDATEPVTADTGLDGVPPLLVVGVTGDASTPYSGAVSLARRVPGSTLVTLKAYQHGGTGASPCVDDAVAAYLVEPGAARDDLTCIPD